MHLPLTCLPTAERTSCCHSIGCFSRRPSCRWTSDSRVVSVLLLGNCWCCAVQQFV